MPEQSSVHVYLNWAKERIDEMDALLASFAAKANKVQADSQIKADQLIGDLKKQRDQFETIVKSQIEVGEIAWQQAKPQLESQWKLFETQVKTYFDTIGKQIGQQQAAFRDVAAAQVKAWHEAADKLHESAARMASTNRAELDAAIKQMKLGAFEAELQLEKMKQAGVETWSVLSAALAESRKAFDRVNLASGDAFMRAAATRR